MRLARRSFLKSCAALLHISIDLVGLGFLRVADAASPERGWRYYAATLPTPAIPRSIRSIFARQESTRRLDSQYGDKMNRPRTTMECTPIVVDGVMYITSLC